MAEDKNQDSPSTDETTEETPEEQEEQTEDGDVEESTDDVEEGEDESAEASDDDSDAEEDDEAEASDDSDDEDDEDDAEASDDSEASDDAEDEDEDDAEASDDAEDEDEDDADDTIGPRGTDGSVGRVAGVDELIDPDDTVDVDIEPDLDISEYSALDDVTEPFIRKRTLAAIIAVGVAIAIGLHFYTLDEKGSVYHDMALLFQGQYLEEMDRRVSAAERDYVEAQEAVIPEYGSLHISGAPREALIHLNGEIQYGETPAGDQWRELRVGPNVEIQDLPIDEEHEVKITHPGFEPYEITLTEEMWRPSGADYLFQLTVNLTPESTEAHREWQSRMMIGQDLPDDEDEFERGDEAYDGTIRFHTVPEGAYLKINSRIARDEDGEKILTPVELDEYWAYRIRVPDLYEEGVLRGVVRDEEALDDTFDQIDAERDRREQQMEEAKENEEALEAGEIDEEDEEGLLLPDDVREFDKLEELARIDARDLDVDERAVSDDLKELDSFTFPVDRPPQQGDSIQIIFPDDHPDADDLFEYATMLQRSMWECQFKDDAERARISDDESLQEHCDFFFEFDLDFFEIRDYIERREEERDAIAEERIHATEKLEDLDDEFDERLRALGHTIEEVDRITPEDRQEDEEDAEAEAIQ